MHVLPYANEPIAAFAGTALHSTWTAFESWRRRAQDDRSRLMQKAERL